MSEPSGSEPITTEREAPKYFRPHSRDHIYMGRFYDPREERIGSEVFYGSDRHLFILGPTGSGKGRRLLIPNLLCTLDAQSVIVIDPKGEAAAITADARRKRGHHIAILNPFNAGDLGSKGFNPLASLDPESPNFYDDASAIGEALIKIEGTDPHWSESAQGLITALVMWEKLQQKDKASLAHVRDMLTEPEVIRRETGPDGETVRKPVAGLRAIAERMVESGGYAVESLASRFVNMTNEMQSVRSTADTQTRWLLSPPVRDDLCKNGVDFARLKDHQTTVYVILPAERLRTHSAWLRLVIVSALRALYKPGGRRVLMIIDEMAALGPLAPLEDAFGLVRGYNVQIAAMLQDLGQLKELYKQRWETFIANAGAVFGFAPNDLTTADWMSKRAGQTTVVAKGFSENTGMSTGEKTSNSSGSGSSDQQIARALLLPQEVMGMEPGTGLLWLAGHRNTIPIFAPDYEKIRACQVRASTNPYSAA